MSHGLTQSPFDNRPCVVLRSTVAADAFAASSTMMPSIQEGKGCLATGDHAHRGLAVVDPMMAFRRRQTFVVFSTAAVVAAVVLNRGNLLSDGQ